MHCQECSVPILRAIDKLEKLGQGVVEQELQEILSSSQIQTLFSFLSISRESPQIDKCLPEIHKLLEKLGANTTCLTRLHELFDLLKAFGITDSSLSLDVSIARGLDYYTGIVFETKLVDFPQIGSISSGGRYDNLASLFSKRELPGVGASIGLDRIIAALSELGQTSSWACSANVLLVATAEQEQKPIAEAANLLRENKIALEIYPDVTKLKNALSYANNKQIPVVVFAGKDSPHKYLAKHMQSGEQKELETIEELIIHLTNHPSGI